MLNPIVGFNNQQNSSFRIIEPKSQQQQPSAFRPQTSPLGYNLAQMPLQVSSSSTLSHSTTPVNSPLQHNQQQQQQRYLPYLPYNQQQHRSNQQIQTNNNYYNQIPQSFNNNRMRNLSDTDSSYIPGNLTFFFKL
jgi:hypothetical protein